MSGIVLNYPIGGLNPLAVETYEILEIIAPSETILGTGHLSIEETVALLTAAQGIGVKRLLITHPEYMAEMSIEDQIKWRDKGVFFDRCYYFTNEASRSIGGVESSVLGSDGGQLKNDYPVELMRTYLRELCEFGFTDKEVERMAVTNPATLFNL